ncbi:spermatogenesis-associated protein 22 isoform X1 [Hydra vulgaris]|uniref:spermatogenesis-associated protein 22 isoform X1 n=1 Tax=Hydra vulgaris TaxID=6087 RepID=UPI00064101BA|nr:spermatogenesis-associated protein 22 [Hydra vulgaris]
MLRQTKKEESSSLVPIFGCRKRQRVSVLADPIDLSGDNEDENFYFNVQSLENQSYQNRSQIERSSKLQKQCISSVTSKSDMKYTSNKNILVQPPQQFQFQKSLHCNNNSINQQGYNIKIANNIQINKKLPSPNTLNEIRSSSVCKQHKNVNFIVPNSSKLSTCKKNLTSLFSISQKESNDLLPWGKGSNKENLQPTNIQRKTLEKPRENAYKFVTTTIKNLKEWSKVTENKPVIFEIFGTMESTVSHCKPEKIFFIKDQLDKIRCVLWEIDRFMPHIPRGSVVRCVGKFNENYFHCFSIRQVKPHENNLVEFLLEKSDQELQNQIVNSREL